MRLPTNKASQRIARMGTEISRRFTLDDLIVSLRFAVSEPNDGTWGVVEYGNEEVPDELISIDELTMVINASQDYTCRDLYDRDFAFFESTFRHFTCPLVTEYPLPGDFMAEEKVVHYHGSDFCQLDQTNLKEIEKLGSYGAYENYTGFYTNYEVRGNVADIIYEGRITEHNKDILIDTARKEKFDNRLRPGDIVMNVTDESVGTVMEIEENKVTVDGLRDGRRDEFLKRDCYKITTKEQPYELLKVWPAVANVYDSEIYNGLPENIIVKECEKLSRIRFYVKELPEGIRAQKTRVHISVVNEDGEPRAIGDLRKELILDWNTVFLEGEINPDETYEIVVSTEEDDKTFVPERVELFSHLEEDFIEIDYTRLPTPMVYSNSVCEMPNYTIPAILAYAKAVCYQKKSGMPVLNDQMLVEYHTERDKIVSMLRRRGESGNRNIFRSPHTGVGQTHQNSRGIYPGWTDIVIFP